MVTLKDVAKKAGVSSATVSRVVRGEGKVGDKCRARVQKIIKDMGYRPNYNARALASNKSEIIGVICPNVSGNFYGSLASGVEEAARNAKYKVLISNSQNDVEKELDAIESFRSQGCQNIILHSKYSDDETLIKWAQEIPGLVILNRFVSQIANRCVWLDNVSGGQQAAKYLLSKGHKKFAVITSSHQITDPIDRLNGICQALSQAGIEVPEDRIKLTNAGVDAGEKAAKELLKKGANFTALLAYNDATAIGAMNAIQDLGFRVPEDISVIGYDDLPICNVCRPRLSTMHYPIKEMALYATKLSLDLTQSKEEVENKTHLFMPHVVERQSITVPS